MLIVLRLSSIAEDVGIMHLATVVNDGVHELAFVMSKNLHNKGLLFLSQITSYTAKDSFMLVPGADMNPTYRAAWVAVLRSPASR